MKLNKPRKKIEFKYIIMIIILVITIIVGILSLVIKDNRSLSFIEGGIKDAVISIEKVIYSPFRYIDKKWHEQLEMKKVYEDYQEDKNKLDKYKLLETENEELKREIKAMKDILDLKETFTDYKIINATVINRNVGSWYNTLTIDKGKKAGLQNDMVVIVNKGLVGKIIKVTNYTSDVKLITTNDLNNKISVGVILDNDKITYGLLSGYERNDKYLLIEGIIDESPVEIGNKVITSGLSDIFPKGILIGTVKDIKMGHYGISKTIYVSSDIDFNDIRFVSILKREESPNVN